MTMISIVDAAHVLRSKNAGPFELTLDILFKNPETYAATKAAGIFSAASLAKLYGIEVEEVLKVIHYDPALAIKATLKRRVSSGAFGETDVYGAQQHAPLLGIMVPERL